jgi:hypothetical protein
MSRDNVTMSQDNVAMFGENKGLFVSNDHLGSDAVSDARSDAEARTK